MKQLLKNKQFLLLNFGQFVSLVGTEMQDFALGLYVLNITKSSLSFSSVLAATILPKIIFGSLFSVFSDWFDKKKIIVTLDLLSAGIIFLFWKVTSSGNIQMYQIYIVVIVLSIISCLFNPTMTSVLPLIIKKDDILQANSINSFIGSLGSLISPLLAGLIMSKISISLLLLLNSISFFLSACSEMFLKIPKVNTRTEFNFNAYTMDFKEGIRTIFTDKILRNIILSICVINLFFNPAFSIGLPFVGKSVLEISDEQYGVFNSITIIGSFLAPVILTYLSKKIKTVRLTFYSLFGCSVMVLLLALNASSLFTDIKIYTNIPYIFLCFVGVGMFMFIGVANICISTTLQEKVDVDKLGRVNGICVSIATSVIPIGQILYGFLFEKLSVSIPLIITAVVLIIIPAILFKDILSNKNNMDTLKVKELS